MKALVLALILSLAAPLLAGGPGPERWNYARASLDNDAGLQKFIDMLKLSKDAGCTHVLVAEGGINRCDAMPKEYFPRVEKALAAAKELGLQVVPYACRMGYSGRYFYYDKNLAAGLPVKDMPFIVKGATATPDPVLAIDVGKLEAETKASVKSFKVRPFTNYRITFRTRSPGDREEYCQVQSQPRWHSRTFATIKKDPAEEGWSIVSTTFNSLEADELRLAIHSVPEDLKDIRIVPAGTLLIVRRDWVPLTVTNADKSVTYQEGEDFKPLTDPCMSKRISGGEITNEHEPAPIELTANSRIKDGQELLVSFWHAQRIYDSQDLISMEDPKTLALFDNELKHLVKAWPCSGYWLDYEEIRIGGWEPMPDPSIKTAGQLLAWHFKHTYDSVRKYAPQAKVYTWSDMFNPEHNARPFQARDSYYYLVNGNWDGSWEGLPKDVIIGNWSNEPKGLKFFADRGNSQILCGYYDVKTTDRMKADIVKWAKNIEGLDGVLGFMYTTYANDWTHMKEYLGLANTYDQWKATFTAPAKN